MRKLLILFSSFFGAAILAGCMSPPPGLDLGLDRLSARQAYRVAIRPLTEPAPLGRLHAWEVRVRSAAGDAVTGARIGVDGGMPQHGHGLPTRPQVRELGDGRYLLEGMKFSMPGWWEISLRIEGRAGADEARFNTIVAFGSPARAAP